MDHPEFIKHKDTLMEFEAWKKLKPKEVRIALLAHWRKHKSDFDIRQAWNLNYGAFYHYIKTMGLNEQKHKQPDEGKKRDRIENAIDALLNESGTEEHNGKKKTFIDAEYVVVDDRKKPRELVVVNRESPFETTSSGAYLNFDFEGDIAYLEKKLKMILGLLEDEPKVRLKIEAYRV